MLALLGVDPAVVEDVILTHMHEDHAGNFGKFPKARFHLQEREMHYAAGRHMRHKQLAKSFEPDDACGTVRLRHYSTIIATSGSVEQSLRSCFERKFFWRADALICQRCLHFDGRVQYHHRPAEVLPGIAVVPVGGHSAGLQFVQMSTRRGVVVLASGVTHFYENMETYRPFITALYIGDMLDGFDTLRAHAASPALKGIAVRLDVPISKQQEQT